MPGRFADDEPHQNQLNDCRRSVADRGFRDGPLRAPRRSWSSPIERRSRSPSRSLVEDEAPRRSSWTRRDSRPVFASAPVSVRSLAMAASARDHARARLCVFHRRSYTAGGVDANADSAGRNAAACVAAGQPPLAGTAAPNDRRQDSGRRRRTPARNRVGTGTAAADRRGVGSSVAHGGARCTWSPSGSGIRTTGQPTFTASLARVRARGSPAPAAACAIGFSSQYEFAKGRIHLGGTRGALHSHILIKERAGNVLEPERLELLVHELGHLIGARTAPSRQRDAAGGRPRPARAARAQDSLRSAQHAADLALMGAGDSRRGVRSLDDVSPDMRRRMGEIYEAVDADLPDDPATGNYLSAARRRGASSRWSRTLGKSLSSSSRVAKIDAEHAATSAVQPRERRRRPAAGDSMSGRRPSRPSRCAATTARGRCCSRSASRSTTTARCASFRWRRRRAPTRRRRSERADRLAVMGQPTMRGRAIWPSTSSCRRISSRSWGATAARSAGLVKELHDANGGSGFSFRDMAADRAGVVFADAVLGGRFRSTTWPSGSRSTRSCRRSTTCARTCKSPSSSSRSAAWRPAVHGGAVAHRRPHHESAGLSGGGSEAARDEASTGQSRIRHAVLGTTPPIVKACPQR